MALIDEILSPAAESGAVRLPQCRDRRHPSIGRGPEERLPLGADAIELGDGRRRWIAAGARDEDEGLPMDLG